MGLDAFLTCQKKNAGVIEPVLKRCPGISEMMDIPYLKGNILKIHIRGHIFSKLKKDRLEVENPGPYPRSVDVTYSFRNSLLLFLRDYSKIEILSFADLKPALDERSYFYQLEYDPDFIRFIKKTAMDLCLDLWIELEHTRGDNPYDTLCWSFLYSPQTPMKVKKVIKEGDLYSLIEEEVQNDRGEFLTVMDDDHTKTWRAEQRC